MTRSLTLIAVLAAAGATSSPLSRHDAKIRTFKALLRQTEQPPDAADATHAAITVAGCRRLGAGYLCRGSLSPVAFSGIPGNTCTFIVAVYPHSTRMGDGTCSAH